MRMYNILFEGRDTRAHLKDINFKSLMAKKFHLFNDDHFTEGQPKNDA